MALGLLKIITIACISFLFAAGSKLAAADCSVKNDSGKKVIIVPVDVDVTIDVDVGATVQVPPPQQKCYFKNAESGKQQGPVTLTDGSTYVCKDGAVEGTIDIYLGAYVLGVLQLVIKIIVSL
ncbi:hypothetical protein KP509_14G019600 [Ceratopteris richardii]|uniref:Uncharacterized protein n=1 Tax=Ceratopteris richardii TaxID=49495 RepID=A0A8T2T7J2_CERRI|nr:hypothetical protein KP509_14G019600 [Ceratopteris richardii]